MNGESDPTLEKANVLPYAVLKSPREWLPPPAWLKRIVICMSLMILVVFLLGLPPLSGALDYTRAIPLTEAIEYAWKKGIRDTLDSSNMIGMAIFAPMAIAGVVAFLYLRGRLAQWITLLANIILPAIWLGGYWPLLVLWSPFILIEVLSGRSDGETWSEGFVSYSAIAAWTLLWLGVAAVLIVRKGLRSRRFVESSD